MRWILRFKLLRAAAIRFLLLRSSSLCFPGMLCTLPFLWNKKLLSSTVCECECERECENSSFWTFSRNSPRITSPSLSCSTNHVMPESLQFGSPAKILKSDPKISWQLLSKPIVVRLSLLPFSRNFESSSTDYGVIVPIGLAPCRRSCKETSFKTSGIVSLQSCGHWALK